MENKVSIIYPIYNVSNYVQKSLRSILNQSYRNIQLIIVDDGSTDNSLNIVKSIMRSNTTEYVILQQENRGQSAARNLGISCANGDYVCFVDSDDVIDTKFIEILVLNAIKSDCDVAYCDFSFVSEQEALPRPDQYCVSIISREKVIDKFLYRKEPIIIPTFIIKRTFLSSNLVRFDENCRFSEDQIFIWDVFLLTERVLHIESKLYFYFQRGGSIMTKFSSEKIINGFNSLKDFTNQKSVALDQYSIKEIVLSRWVLGSMYTAANTTSFSEFLIISREMNYRKHMIELLKFKDSKTILASILALLSMKLFYLISRRN